MSKVILGLGTEPGFDDHLNTYVSCWIKTNHSYKGIGGFNILRFSLVGHEFPTHDQPTSPPISLNASFRKMLGFSLRSPYENSSFLMGTMRGELRNKWCSISASKEDGRPTSPICLTTAEDFRWLIGAGTVNLQQVSCNNTLPQLVFIGL